MRFIWLLTFSAIAGVWQTTTRLPTLSPAEHRTMTPRRLKPPARAKGKKLGSCGRKGPTVEAHILGEGLGAEELEALVGEEAHRVRVAVQVARREALVRVVEEGDVALLLRERGAEDGQPGDAESRRRGAGARSNLDDGRDALPLRLARVHAGRVVRADVQEDDGSAGGGLARRGEEKAERGKENVVNRG
jgi:hypothetical protein